MCLSIDKRQCTYIYDMLYICVSLDDGVRFVWCVISTAFNDSLYNFIEMASPKRTFGVIGVRSSLDRHDRIVEAKVSYITKVNNSTILFCYIIDNKH